MTVDKADGSTNVAVVCLEWSPLLSDLEKVLNEEEDMWLLFQGM